MLVLSRKPGEVLRIGDAIRLEVVRIGPNTVRIGIEAPKDLAIVREELLLRIAEESLEESVGDAA